MRNSLLSLLLVLLCSSALAQTASSIRSSRPGQAIEPFTVGKKIGQIQTGYSLQWRDLGTNLYKLSGSEAVLRYGVIEKLEFNALLNYAAFGIGDPIRYTGLDELHVGGKYNLYEGRGLVPSIGIQGRVKLPYLSERFKGDRLAPTFTISAQNSLTDELSLTFNTGFDWDVRFPGAIWFYVVNLNHTLGDRWGVFVENYGNRSGGFTRVYFDGGCSFLVNSNLQLDFSTGAGFLSLFTEYFVAPGLSWRFL